MSRRTIASPRGYGDAAAGELRAGAEAHAREPDASASRSIAERRDGELLLEGEVRVACLDAQVYRPRPLPQIVMQEISEGDDGH